LETVDEINEYFNPSSDSSNSMGTGMLNPWRMTPNEVRQALKLRNDFNPQDIKKLRL
jgi:hypothetical protein